MSDDIRHYHRITNYEEFVDYCLRRLGAPVIDINLHPEQVEDRISDAVQYYIEYDLESVANCWWLHKVTADDVKNGYLSIPPDVLDVMEVLTPGTGSIMYSNSGTVGTNLYDFSFMENPQYQWFNYFWYYGGSLVGSHSMFYYEVSMEYLNMLNTLLTAKVEFLYRRRQRKLYLYSQDLVENALICLYGTKILDPENDDCIWESDWLKAYATALLGIQWGTNLSKFGSVPSAGNLTINCDAILARYQEEKAKLEEEHKLAYQEPPLPFFG